MTQATVDARVLLCSNCGGPLQAPTSGGKSQCSFCGQTQLLGRLRETPIRIEHPTLGQALAPAARESRRQQLLREQAYSPKTQDYHYSPMRLPGWGYLQDVPPDNPMRPALLLQGLLNAIALCRGSNGAFDDQCAVAWVALELMDEIYVQRDALHALAALETALDAVSDPVFEQMLTCALAEEALESGDLEAAESWLSLCDPSPPWLGLDCQLRVARARILLHRGEPGSAIRIVGESPADGPVSPAHAGQFLLVRVTSLELLGRGEAAESLFRSSVDQLDPAVASKVARDVERDPCWKPALAVVARLKKGRLLLQRSAQLSRPTRGCSCAPIALTALLCATVIAVFFALAFAIWAFIF